MNVTDTVCLLQQSEVNNSAVTDNCSCLCEKLWTFLSAAPPEVVNLTVEEKVDIIVQELTVDKKNTTLNQRKYVSVMDYRTSSMSLGIVAGVIILSVIGVIIIIDLSTIWTEISNFLIKMFKVLKPPKSRIKTPIDGHAGKEDVTPNVAAEDFGNREKNTENSENTSTNNISGVGWFLRERLVYRGIALENTKLELASSETNNKNTRMSTHSALTSEV
ncbi:uncharacterized protein LOC123547651 [Mercenaria mercenaria]|uniref:uncharacterized protein LOC123547651 n=1 Tax=Mercenaria mercenaria TaxID=6596 RepID=UPI00234EE66D|nr:uncharacterized protein LOC123547651 [Mercenaria mercenaria]